MTITFKTPPINEVVLGVGFLPRQDLLIPHFGQFWELIKAEYPKISHAAPVIAPGAQPLVDQFGAWLPRVWFISADDSRVVQLQQDQLFVNWRQTEQSTSYPRFPTVRREFERVWDVFQKFLISNTNVPAQQTRAELSYVNSISQGNGWTGVADVAQVLRDFKWADGKRFLPPPARFTTAFDFDIGDETTLSVKAGTAIKKADNSETMRFELIARASVSPTFNLSEWIERSHELIVRAFKDMTTEQMHGEAWQLQQHWEH